MDLRLPQDLPLAHQRVFLRCDFNVPLKNGVIQDFSRIQAALPTIDFLLKQECSIVLASHLGRPKSGFESSLSLEPIGSDLRSRGYNVQLDDFQDQEATRVRSEQLNQGQILLLENVRFYSGETKNDESLGQFYGSLAPFYINDAFGAAHRAHASVVSALQYFKPGHIAAGFLMEKEIKGLNHILHPQKPLVCIFGGSKIGDKISLIKHFINRADHILIGGAMAYAFLKAQGVPIGSSLIHEGSMEQAEEILSLLKSSSTQLHLPIDHITSPPEGSEVLASITEDVEVPGNQKALYIGPETIASYNEEIRKAATILWNGPMGWFEEPAYSTGTLAIAEQIALQCQNGAYAAVGGGDSLAAVNLAGVTKKISHMSTGGGASLEYLSGAELPGLANLIKR